MMTTTIRRILACLLSSAFLALAPLPSLAQSGRYAVGQHLRALEKTWTKHGADIKARQRIVSPLFDAFRNFFAANWSGGAKNLDHARHLLISPEPPPAEVRWAESLTLHMGTRLLDAAAKELPLKLVFFYKVDVETPDKAAIRLTLHNAQGKLLQPALSKEISALPLQIKLPLKNLPAGDHTLQMEIVMGAKVQAATKQTLSIINNSKKRLATLRKNVNALSDKPSTTGTETVRLLASLLNGLASGNTYETNYPAARLLAEAEAVVKAIQAGQTYYGKKHTGQFWLRLPTKDGKHIARLFVPDQAKKGKPLPLVIALHGAGGSENLFFEAYGRGMIVDLCKKRGWLLAAPRSPSIAFRYPVAATVDALARRYPVDRKRIFLVGHSMGAAQAVRAVQETPKYFAAAAVLGGSGSLKDSEKIKKSAFFIGVGTRDFAFEGARRMARKLKEAGVSCVQLREYRQVEHIMVVQESLPDVFAFFDQAAK